MRSLYTDETISLFAKQLMSYNNQERWTIIYYQQQHKVLNVHDKSQYHINTASNYYPTYKKRLYEKIRKKPSRKPNDLKTSREEAIKIYRTTEINKMYYTIRRPDRESIKR